MLAGVRVGADGTLVSRAPAKLNLSLSVLGRRADGWHELTSLVAFTRFGDGLQLSPDVPLELIVHGPTAAAAGPVADNLVLKAASAFAAAYPAARIGRFTLTKRLPAAAGIGGGSSDAATALRMLAHLNGITIDDHALFEVAASIGADVPVCLAAKARIMAGTGDELGPLLALPPMFAVLVNPGVTVETPRVFAAMNLAAGQKNFDCKRVRLGPTPSAAELFAALKTSGNDMEDAACRLAPVIVDVLAVLSAARGCQLARMSGSGATCFALFETCRAASRAARAIARHNRTWWIKASVVG